MAPSYCCQEQEEVAAARQLGLVVIAGNPNWLSREIGAVGAPFSRSWGPLLHRESFIHCNEASHLLGLLRQIPNYVCSAWRLRSEPRYEIAASFEVSERNG